MTDARTLENFKKEELDNHKMSFGAWLRANWIPLAGVFHMKRLQAGLGALLILVDCERDDPGLFVPDNTLIGYWTENSLELNLNAHRFKATIWLLNHCDYRYQIPTLIIRDHENFFNCLLIDFESLDLPNPADIYARHAKQLRELWEEE